MLIRVVFLLAALVLIGLIAWALSVSNFSTSFSTMVREPWGLVTLVDLYLGFSVTSALILAAEGFNRKAMGWIALLLIFGNVVSAFWVATRGYRFLEMMKSLSSR